MPARRIKIRSEATEHDLFVSQFMPSKKTKINSSRIPCKVVAREKRRAGGTRYWCLAHRADATAKYGKPARKCRAADLKPIGPREILTLDLNRYRGGIALWGAVPAIYDTTRLPMDRGIHVHARLTPDANKEMDLTYRAVKLIGKGLPNEGIVVNEIDAIYYMVSSIFGFEMTHVSCTHCGGAHLDKDWFSVNPHKRHLCAKCGWHFYDKVTGIGNPIIGVRRACGIKDHKVVPARERLKIRQSDYPGGIQIWGSNPAFLWTGVKAEESGIHVHAFLENQSEPALDETYRQVLIDDIQLDPQMVRVLMAQNVMPSLGGRVQSMNCNGCGQAQFDSGLDSFRPSASHSCKACGCEVSASGRVRKVVANPLPAILKDLAKFAPCQPQWQKLDLLEESL